MYLKNTIFQRLMGELIREAAAKKSYFLVVRPLREKGGEGGKGRTAKGNITF